MELQHEPRLADARVSGDEYELVLFSLDLLQAIEPPGPLALSTDKGGEAALDRHIESGPFVPRRGDAANGFDLDQVRHTLLFPHVTLPIVCIDNR